MLKTLFMALLAVLIAGLIVDARFLDEPYFLTSRAFVEEPLHLIPLTVPRRTIRQVLENQPLPCRFKLCVSFY